MAREGAGLAPPDDAPPLLVLRPGSGECVPTPLPKRALPRTIDTSGGNIRIDAFLTCDRILRVGNGTAEVLM